MMKTAKTAYRNPGTGAIEFARQYVEGLTRKEALLVIERLLKGELHDSSDKRIKRCVYCGYYYRDKTRPNNSKNCSRECKIANDTLKRAKKRADTALLKPKKERDIEKEMYTYYAYWLEYPYYISEHYMLRRAHNHERPFTPDKLAQIDAAKQRGYKRKGYVRPTDGSDKVHVRGLRYKHSYGEVTTTHMKRDEIDQYLIGKYGEKKLKMERWRAIQFSCSKKCIYRIARNRT